MRFGRILAAAALAAAIGATPARALTQGEEAGFSLLAAWANVLYVPAKIIVSAVSLPVGALGGWISGGNTRSAYAIWVPTAGGDWFLTNEHMEGARPIRFFGDDYADTPSTYGHADAYTDTYNARYDRGRETGSSMAVHGPTDSAR